MDQIGPYISKYGLENHGLKGNSTIHWNQASPQLYEAGLRRGESRDGACGIPASIADSARVSSLAFLAK